MHLCYKVASRVKEQGWLLTPALILVRFAICILTGICFTLSYRLCSSEPFVLLELELHA